MTKVLAPSEQLAVVVPVYNQHHLTERCLASLLTHSTCVREVWIIDNASQDQTSGVLIRFQKKFEFIGIPFHIITNPENLGFGRACNQGVRGFLSSNAGHLAILNNDTWLMQDWDRALICSLKKNHMDCVGPYFYEKEFTPELHSLAKNFVSKNGKSSRRHFVPILMLFTRSAIQKLSQDCPGTHGGIFDERFFVTYEDTDLLERMNHLKLNYQQTGACFIWHFSKGTRDHLPSGYEQEGLLLFMEKWGFDPRLKDHTFTAKLRRRYWKILEKYGRF